MEKRQRDLVASAQAGDRAALEELVRGVQDRVHRLALRMTADPEQAQDATQEILIRIVTRLSTFRGESAFDTWVHRVAINHLLTTRTRAARDPALSFADFAEDLQSGLADEAATAPEDRVMLNELRVACTMAMLLCLDRNHRAAYVLGEILEFDQSTACDILETSRDTYRKRLSRARAQVIAFTARSCGLANASAACSCERRLPAAVAAGRISREGVPISADAPSLEETRALARTAGANIVAAKLQRATGPLRAPRALAEAVLRIVDPPG